jgi:hypothetical protein
MPVDIVENRAANRDSFMSVTVRQSNREPWPGPFDSDGEVIARFRTPAIPPSAIAL